MTKQLRAALLYASYGWKIFPVKGKIPIAGVDRGHLDATDDTEIVTKWWTTHPDASIALHLRASGLIAIDVDPRNDGDKNLAQLEALHGPLPRALNARSGSGGEHVLMADPSPGNEGWTRKQDYGGSIVGKLAHGVDVKCNGYVVLAPSVNSEGNPYKWISTGAPPCVPPAWLTLLRKPIDGTETKGPGIEAWQASYRMLDPWSGDALRQKLRSLGPGGCGKSTTFAAISTIFHDFGQSIEDGWRYLLEWNQQRTKPYPVEALQRQVRRVSKRSHENERGYLLEAAELSHALSSMREDKADVTPINGANGHAKKRKYFSTGISDFMGNADPGEDENAWVVLGLIPRGAPACMAGPPKTKKSFIMYYLAICIATGRPAFGKPTKRERVLILTREDGSNNAREIQRRLWRIATGMGVTKEELEGWLFVEAKLPFYFDRADNLTAIQEAFAELRPGVVFFDNLSRIHTADENDRSAMAGITNAWNDLCTLFSCSIVILHHFNKSAEGSAGKRLRGTGDLYALVRVLIGIDEGPTPEESRVDVQGNMPQMAAPFTVKFSDVNENGTKAILLRAKDKSTQKVEERTTSIREALMVSLQMQPSYKSRKLLFKALKEDSFGFRQSDVLAEIKKMVEEGIIIEAGGVRLRAPEF